MSAIGSRQEELTAVGDLRRSAKKMDTPLDETVARILTEYDAGMITDSEATGRIIRSAATIPVAALFESVPENLEQRIRSDVSSWAPHFDKLMIVESDCSLRSIEEIRADRERKLQATIQGCENIFRYIESARKKLAEQGGAEQPATAPDSKSEGSEKPKPESEGRSQ